MFYILQGKIPIPCDDIEEWTKWLIGSLADASRVVAQEEVGDYWVSTVFVGTSIGPLPMFETMVFDAKRLHSMYQERYPTWELALEGHRRAVEWARNRTN